MQTETKELEQINKTIEPWLDLTAEREICQVILQSGTEVTITCPLGAAVEIEEAGHVITVH